MKIPTQLLLPARPDNLLRLEALVSLALCCLAYQRFCPGHWGVFALLFLAPDVSLLGFVCPNKKLAAIFYNMVHSYTIPLALGLIAWNEHWIFAGEIVLIWLAHISFDRLLGYGLKVSKVFTFTHIQSAT